MSVLLQVKDICKRYGAVTILDNATASFSKNQKIGVIGRNGAGKSTLCKIIIGQEEMDSGTISRNSELRLSYLEQHDPYKPDESIIDFLVRYTGKEEWQCGEMAGRFQIGYEMLASLISSLPGGFRTRVKLTAMLLGDPNFLILDEPTNYLDLSTLILLENFLRDFNGGYLIVSHDREFLKKTCDHTLEVEIGKVTLYPGGVEEYFEFKEEQLQQKMAYNRTIEKKKEQLQDFVDRFKAKASTATRAKSKMKQIEKLKTIEIDHPMSTINIRIPAVERKAGIALNCDNLSVGYAERTVANGIHVEVNRGAKVAILGDNGQGKTTFMRTVAGDLQPKSGSFKWGTGLKVAYYAQHVFSSLHPQDDVFTHLSRMAAPGVSQQDILDIAGCFLFKGEEVKKKVTVLSGGERARVCLAGILLSKSHVLLLDEPTNHLDFETVEALANALKEFEGTVFFISHDRTFVNMIATNILDVKNGKIMRYPGTYEDYVYHLEVQAQDENFSDGQGEHKKKPHSHKKHYEDQGGENEDKGSGQNDIAARSGSGLSDKEIKVKVADLKAKITKVERRVEHLTKERDIILEDMKKNPFHFSKERNAKMKEVTIQIEEDEASWGKLQQELEKLEKGAQ